MQRAVLPQPTMLPLPSQSTASHPLGKNGSSAYPPDQPRPLIPSLIAQRFAGMLATPFRTTLKIAKPTAVSRVTAVTAERLVPPRQSLRTLVDPTGECHQMSLKAKLALRFLIALIALVGFGALLFIPAGSLRYWQGWAYLVI